ncbi:hypothetical protein BCR32DRAFT_267894 [Anaeromyces robustus]|uniref:Uncharacterized protein n=1 Tax=Anaeromyces robustus TaxID=1754192 RepID=A0A1Y1X8J1_9FUNG|nr:hypothetical protein BCR32DRAFT_267894 [Anaeromyces robustus]|eukprot:ORX82060.1 hypothetical protein BCR32DRAFT_267894 [Anaeromyces robustus]
MVCGWFINMFLYKTMVKKITKKIQMKYDQHKIIEQLKEELEEENTQDINKSLESIVTIKKIVKKEKSFKNYVEASLLCKFIMYNRSTESFLLVQRIFKECVTEFPRNPNVYIEFWNHLHGMRIFISKNKMFFDDYNFLLKSINILADKVLYKVSNLDINLITKFRIYYSSFSYEESKEILNKRNYDKDDNDDNKNDTSVGFEVDMVKNIAVNYHIKCIISKKNIINELTNITNMETIESALNMNEEFSKVLLKAEKYYLIYINKFINSKEALYLYIMFLNNIMVMPALADEYLKRLEEKETEEKSDDDSYNERTKSYGYEKSEGVSSTSSSCTGNKRLKMLRHNMKYKFQKPIINMYRIMQIFITLMIIIGIVSNYENRKVFKKVISAVSGIHIGFQLPFIASRIKTDVRLSSLGLAANDRSIADYYLDDLKLNIDYLENTYLPFIYLRHSINVMDLFTVCPINNDVIDLTHNQNYFQNALRIHKKAKLYIDKFNQTENILNMDTLSDPIIRFFRVNSQNRFGPIFIKAIDLVVADNKKSINNQMRFVYIVIMILVLFEIFIIFGVITPSTNKCVSTLKEVFNVFKFIPKNYLDDLLNEYDSQLNEIYNKYNDDVMQLTTENDEKNNNNNNKKKVYSTKKLKLNFIIFSIISGILIILPFLTILLFKNQLINSISYLANSSKRTYYANSVGLLAFETLFQDESSFGKKISALLFENAEILQSYENKLKSGYYGATITDISVLNPYLSRPSCVRPKRLEFQCQNRTYDTVYTEELANSSLNYIMTEYIDKLNEFFGNMEGDYAISLIKPLDEVLHKILDHPFLSFYKKIIYDIAGHTLKYNEIGCEYLMKDVSFYLSLTLYTHCITSILLLILFSFYVTKKIKQQLHIMDVLTNVVFSVPLTLYDSSPRLKMFIETGKLK